MTTHYYLAIMYHGTGGIFHFRAGADPHPEPGDWIFEFSTKESDLSVIDYPITLPLWRPTSDLHYKAHKYRWTYGNAYDVPTNLSEADQNAIVQLAIEQYRTMNTNGHIYAIEKISDDPQNPVWDFLQVPPHRLEAESESRERVGREKTLFFSQL